MIALKRYSAFLSLAFLASVLGFSAWLQRNDGLDHPEHYQTIPHYLSQKSLPAKIFDIKETEAPPSPDNYQARELSYFTDYLDVKAMAVAVPLGLAHSLSVVKFLSTFLILLMWRIFLREQMGLSERVSFLLLLLLLSSPAFFWGGFFHRTAKIDVALLFTALVVWCASVWRSPERYRGRVFLFTFLLGFLLSICDMQGYWAVLVGTAVLLALRDRRATKLFWPFLSATGAYLVYKWVLGPRLIRVFNGYSPQFGYQQLPLAKVAHDLGTYGTQSWQLFLDYCRFLLGNIPSAVAGMLVLAMIASPWLQRKPEKKAAWIHVGVFLLVLAAMLAMFMLMAAREDSILLPPYRRVYYPLLPTVIVFAGLVFSIQQVCRWSRVGQAAATAMLCLLIVGNIAADQGEHRKILYRYGLGSSGKTYARLYVLRHWTEFSKDIGEIRKRDAILQAMSTSLP
jgi:hypothetical protein